MTNEAMRAGTQRGARWAGLKNKRPPHVLDSRGRPERHLRTQIKRSTEWGLPRSVKGHAVLPVLACKQIVMAKDADLGAAGISERGAIDATLRRAYTEIAERHRTVQPAVALGSARFSASSSVSSSRRNSILVAEVAF